MIPKIIHYCWISDESNMSQRIKDCITSWKKYMPEYEFINWNDKNFDWNISEFTKHCRKNNIYAFCSDYVRFWALYNYGGIYLDTDVMVYKSFNELLDMKRIVTREHIWNYANLEAAILGAEKGDTLYGKLIEFYNTTDKFPPNNAVIAPWAMLKVIQDNDYKLNPIENINDRIDNDDTINVIDCKKYFDLKNITSDTFATHLFNNQWWNKDYNIVKG